MINLINTYVEMQKKLNEEYEIIGVSTGSGKPRVHVYGLESFLDHGKGIEIKVIEREGDIEYHHEATFTRNNIEFFILLDKEDYEEIIKIEGVKHE